MSEPRKTLYLVDGTAQMFRAYFAIRGLSTPDGLPTNAVYGFTAMLRKLIREERPEYLAVAFDLAGATFREERYADYKANRPAPPEDLNVQFPYARRVCEVLDIPVLELEGYEADDLIATFVREGRERGFEVVIVASDKDLLQLVGDGVICLNPTKEVKLDADGVRESFGVPPERVRDVLGLMGDAVDNIPGVPGVGEKTAKELVSVWGDVDDVLERAARFVAAYDARDRLLASLDGGGASTEEFVGAARALARDERDDDLRSRLEAAIEAAGAGAADPKAARALGKALRDLDRKSGKRAWYAVHEHREQALLSRELATVDRRVPVPFEAERLRLGPPDRAAAARLFSILGFRTLTAEFSEEPEEGGAVPEVAGGDDAEPEYDAVLDAGRLAAEVAACRAAGRFAVDTETDSVDPMRARLVGISLAHAPGRAVYVPVGHRYDGAPAQLSLDAVRATLGPLLADPGVGKIGQNVKYDLHVLRRHGLEVRGLRLDTMVAAFLLDSGRTSYGMDGLAREYLGYRTIPYEEVAGKGADERTLDEVEISAVTRYAAEDADVTLRLAETFEPMLRHAGLDAVYRDVDGPVIPVLERMEAHGIRVDVEMLRSMSAEMERGLDGLRDAVHELAGEPFNVDSPKQLREVLFDRLGLRPGRKTAKGKVFSTDAQTLEDLAGEHSIAARILEYRELAKLKGTYVDALPALVNPETGRIHTSFHPTGAATGRLSSSDPNLQNIPARSPSGLRVREAFVPDPGHRFVASDYSQVELRVLAHLCGDPELVAAFRAGEDIHRHTASRVFGVDPGLVTPEMRRRAKAVNFGILYGMSETRLAREQGMRRSEARAFIEAYFERFAAVRRYVEEVRDRARRDAAVRTLFGRVRYFPQLHQRVARNVQEQALRAAVNTTIQGTAADLMKMAMARVDAALAASGSRARMLLQVHDELLLEVPDAEVEAVAALVRREMEGVYALEAPLAVDQKTGGNWREVT